MQGKGRSGCSDRMRRMSWLDEVLCFSTRTLLLVVVGSLFSVVYFT